MKKALLLIVVLAVLLLAGPGAFGWWAERDAETRINQLLEGVSFVTIAEHRYHRGWFSSDETITFELFRGMPLLAASEPAEAAASKPLRISVHNVIHHGPFPGLAGIGVARIDSELAPPSGATVAGPTPSLGPLSIRTYLGFLGGATTEIRHPAIPATDVGDGWHIATDAIDFTIREGHNANSIDVAGKAPHLLVTHDNGTRLELSGLQASMQSTRALRSIYVGNSEIVLGEFDARTPARSDRPQPAVAEADPNDPSAAGAGAGDFSLRALKVTGHSEAVGGFLNGMGTVSAMYAGAGAYHVQGLKIDGGVEHLQLDAFERLTDGLRKIQREHPGSPADQATAMQQLWKTAGIPLATNDPVFVVRTFQFAAAGGFATFSGSVRIRGATDADFNPTVNMGSLLGKVNVDLDVAVDEPLFERLAAPKPAAGTTSKKPAATSPVQAMIMQGYLTDDHGRLRTKIQFASGQLTLNGKPFAPGRLADSGAPTRP